MKFHQWVFKILKKQNVTDGRTDGHTDGRTDGQRENSIPPLKLRFGGGYKYVYPCISQFYYIKVGYKGVFILRTCFPDEISRAMRKLDFCICENKEADQLCSYCSANQHLCFRHGELIPSSSYIRNSLLTFFLRLYRPVCVRPGRKPQRLLFL